VAAEIVMPRLSDSMEEGTVLRWLKSEGEEVAVGDELVEIETDKANMVYESDAAGTLIEIVANEGDTLGIGEVIARVGDASEANGAGKKKKGKDRKAAGNGGKPEAAGENTAGIALLKQAQGFADTFNGAAATHDSPNVVTNTSVLAGHGHLSGATSAPMMMNRTAA